MNGNIRRIKKDLRDKITNISNFDEFDAILRKLSNDVKGIF